MNLRRVWIPLSACALSAAFAIIGGACLPSSSPSPPALHDGRYVLISAGLQSPPQVTFTNTGGSRVRVIADTLQFTTATKTYVERGTIAVTPAGGTEQAPTAIALGTQNYSLTGASAFDLTTVAGLAHGTVLSDAAIDLRMADGSHWNYQIR